MPAVMLPNRGLVKIVGEGARDFLQGVLTADMRKVTPEQPVYAALLSPQGKVLFDMLLIEAPPAMGGGFLADVPLERADALVTALNRYKLRAKALVENISAVLAVTAIWDEPSPPAGPVVFADPRSPALGWRVIGAKPLVSPAVEGLEAYEAHRIACGVAEGGADFVYGDIYAHEINMDRMGQLAFDKGCYVGQEIVARMEMRKLTRSRLMPVRIEGAAPPMGEAVLSGEKVVGAMGSAAGSAGLALLKLEAVSDEGAPLMSGAARLVAER